ncbi:bifunctional folylpolyglutamate synthase/dihydrofolate synthase [Pseudalkalibacillus salsuginis]|uniref:bifunctional folylpolyglutamate synthase/dihydrofolate synthase n=1 Tax=Pseudalkalibacillus salsuginis TaxID=2910972 RepID=UPI001F1D230F|nr:folylpolyglutamate synthase/dihydrofolate synthase family protein [Pseudalkalibacillus salsuginis]MCF6408669.1 bifunctional folylpolyglutamate synthase/dihydrofolate synthase [Pseudalkalibacillus salsuginis]
MKTYEETLHWIHELLAFGMKPGLLRMEWMLKELGHPEKELTSIHLAGTNGKGSTLTYMRCILQEAGYTVGTFTSPYIERFNERISINGEPITDEELVMVANDVRPIAETLAATDLGTPTEFEVVTILSIVYFARYRKADIILFETGLGGRLDSTNVIHPILTGITNVGYDHTAILGNALHEIAYEKSGIIKKGAPLVTGVEQEEAIQVVEEKAKAKNVPVTRLNKDYFIKGHEVLQDGELFTLWTQNRTYENLHIKMKGFHQVKNAAMGIIMIEVLKEHSEFDIQHNHIQNGLLQAEWPGRFEKMSQEPLIILDGAHNKEGIASLRQTLITHYPERRKRMIFSALSDKPVNEMLSELYDCIDHIMFTSFNFPRASSASSLYDRCIYDSKDLEEDFETALRKELDRMEREDVLIVTGSLYFISIAREILKNMK